MPKHRIAKHDEIYPLEPLFGRILSPLDQFLHRTTAAAIVLIGCTIPARGLATAFGSDAIHHFTDKPLALFASEALTLGLSVHEWVNDGLMTFFFLLVGLELKREIMVGELSSLKDAALPVVAALGGMVLPAFAYALFNAGTPAASGWGIPMATDIAFAVGILILLGSRVPKNLIIFLTALAIADDLGAVLVIAVFYTADINLHALAAAASLVGLLLLCNRAGIRHPLPYAVLGVLLWFAVHSSGVHATLSGVLLAIAIPARPAHTPAHFERRIAELQSAFRANRRDKHATDDPLSNQRMASIAHAMERSAVAVQSPLQRIEHGLTPWVTFLIIPVFALSNAGIDLSSITWSEALASKITLGVMSGLLAGKFAGITLFSWIAIQMGIARLPAGVSWKHLMGAAWLAGIGFTMSLFIAQLGLTTPEAVDQAKLGILLGSSISALIGLLWLYLLQSRIARKIVASDQTVSS